jgi:uroporphyrin-III C-methyltransferase
VSDFNHPVETAASEIDRQKPTKSRAGLWLMVIFLLLISVSLIVFLWEEHKKLINFQLAFNEQRMENDIQRSSFREKISDELNKQQQQFRGELLELSQRQESTAARVQGLNNTTNDDWKLTEVNFLLRMANQRILLEHETANALALAESANDVLAELENSDLFPARKKLAEEIQALKLVSKVDREGIYLQLLALTQQIENLPLIEPLVDDDEIENDDSDTLIATTLWEKITNLGKRTLHKLSRHVRVRDQGRRIDAILPPEDQLYLKQNLRLMLEQAQTGLLREEQHVYQASLDKAQDWIRDYYPLNEQAEIVLNDLAQLQKNIVQQTLPNFSASSALIKEYMTQKDKLAIKRHGER